MSIAIASNGITYNVVSMPCANCGTRTLVAEMLRDHHTGEWHCTECPGEGWLRRTYGDEAAKDLAAMREGRPAAPSLSELRAMYPERSGMPRLPTCPKGHPFDEANTYHRRDGRRACRACIADWKRARRAREAA